MQVQTMYGKKIIWHKMYMHQKGYSVCGLLTPGVQILIPILNKTFVSEQRREIHRDTHMTVLSSTKISQLCAGQEMVC